MPKVTVRLVPASAACPAPRRTLSHALPSASTRYGVATPPPRTIARGRPRHPAAIFPGRVYMYAIDGNSISLYKDRCAPASVSGSPPSRRSAQQERSTTQRV